MTAVIRADNKDFRMLNQELKQVLKDAREVWLKEVNGQRYIGAGLEKSCYIGIEGVPGNDLGIFMDGPFIQIYGNVQDGTANTMNSGRIVVHGSAGDILGYSMRGGEVYIRDNAGYRAGVHMKEYGSKKPVIIIGGTAGDFLGEYMAGGIILVLNLENETIPVGDFCGSGMHGGVIYIRGKGNVASDGFIMPLETGDIEIINFYVNSYKEFFACEVDVKEDEFIKIVSSRHRPYKKLYAGC